MNTAESALLLFLSLGACSPSTPFIAKEYMWVQKEDGLMMKAPITIRVRVRWVKDTLYWSENVTDAKGFQDLRTEKYYSFSVPALGGAKCEYWDSDNWSCESRSADYKVFSAQKMKDGKMMWYYWGDTREMKTRYLIWNKPLPFP